MSGLPTTTLGRTGLPVTKLGYGAMELRGPAGGRGRPVQPEEAQRVLNAVLDSGINYIDTSPDYGGSEELIGQYLSSRRDEYFLASKCGCVVGQEPAPAGQPNRHVFTRENIRAGVEQSLRRMRTDHLDVVQFHASPPRSVLEENGAVDELVELRSEGKIRFLGMSGTIPNLADHIAMGVFDVFQIPYSAVELEHGDLIAEAAEAGAGNVIRGGVARGAPVASSETLVERPAFREVLEQRRDRFAEAQLDDVLDGMSPMEFMLRFTISHPGMHTTIVGTKDPAHLLANVEAAAKGTLPPDQYQEALRRLSSV